MALSEQQRILTIATVISEVIQQNIDECDVICHEVSQPLIAEQDILNSRRDGTSQFTGIEDYIERTVTGYSDPYFYKHFRMSRMSFQVGHYLLNFEKMKV
jgi:hypothetical protein